MVQNHPEISSSQHSAASDHPTTANLSSAKLSSCPALELWERHLPGIPEEFGVDDPALKASRLPSRHPQLIQDFPEAAALIASCINYGLRFRSEGSGAKVHLYEELTRAELDCYLGWFDGARHLLDEPDLSKQVPLRSELAVARKVTRDLRAYDEAGAIESHFGEKVPEHFDAAELKRRFVHRAHQAVQRMNELDTESGSEASFGDIRCCFSHDMVVHGQSKRAFVTLATIRDSEDRSFVLRYDRIAGEDRLLPMPKGTMVPTVLIREAYVGTHDAIFLRPTLAEFRELATRIEEAAHQFQAVRKLGIREDMTDVAALYTGNRLFAHVARKVMTHYNNVIPDQAKEQIPSRHGGRASGEILLTELLKNGYLVRCDVGEKSAELVFCYGGFEHLVKLQWHRGGITTEVAARDRAPVTWPLLSPAVFEQQFAQLAASAPHGEFLANPWSGGNLIFRMMTELISEETGVKVDKIASSCRYRIASPKGRLPLPGERLMVDANYEGEEHYLTFHHDPETGVLKLGFYDPPRTRRK